VCDNTSTLRERCRSPAGAGNGCCVRAAPDLLPRWEILEILLRSLRVCASEPQTIRRIPGAVHRRLVAAVRAGLAPPGFHPSVRAVSPRSRWPRCAGCNLTARYRRASPHRRGIPGDVGTANAGVPWCTEWEYSTSRNEHRSTVAAGLEEDGQRTIVGGPARARGVAIDDWGDDWGTQAGGPPIFLEILARTGP
jgi:hypothetical protein